MSRTVERPKLGCQDGGKIRSLREGAGYSRPEFAELIGISLQSLINIEHNNRPAGLAMVIRIARALETPVDDVLKDAA